MVYNVYASLIDLPNHTKGGSQPGPFWAPGILCGRRQVVHNPIDQVLLFATIPNRGL